MAIGDNQLRRQTKAKKPGGEVANPHAGFLNINLVSSLCEAVSRQLSAFSKKLADRFPELHLSTK
jgi:hypothetical protein